jgi:hypothetical protein
MPDFLIAAPASMYSIIACLAHCKPAGGLEAPYEVATDVLVTIGCVREG